MKNQKCNENVMPIKPEKPLFLAKTLHYYIFYYIFNIY